MLTLPKRDVDMLIGVSDCMGEVRSFEFQHPNLVSFGGGNFFCFAYTVLPVPSGPPRRVPAESVYKGVLEHSEVVGQTLYSAVFDRHVDDELLCRFSFDDAVLRSFIDYPDYHKLVVAFRRQRMFILHGGSADLLGTFNVAGNAVPPSLPLVAFPYHNLVAVSLALVRMGHRADLCRIRLHQAGGAEAALWACAETPGASFKFVLGSLRPAVNEALAERMAFL